MDQSSPPVAALKNGVDQRITGDVHYVDGSLHILA